MSIEHELQPHEMDALGVHSDADGVIWLPRSLYTREQARTFIISEFNPGCRWIEIRVRARWMRYAPDDPRAIAYDSDFWCECQADAPGAFQVWRCE